MQTTASNARSRNGNWKADPHTAVRCAFGAACATASRSIASLLSTATIDDARASITGQNRPVPHARSSTASVVRERGECAADEVTLPRGRDARAQILAVMAVIRGRPLGVVGNDLGQATSGGVNLRAAESHRQRNRMSTACRRRRSNPNVHARARPAPARAGAVARERVRPRGRIACARAVRASRGVRRRARSRVRLLCVAGSGAADRGAVVRRRGADGLPRAPRKSPRRALRGRCAFCSRWLRRSLQRRCSPTRAFTSCTDSTSTVSSGTWSDAGRIASLEASTKRG